MSSGVARLKDLINTYVPEVVLRRLKAWHYLRTLRTMSDVEEPDLKVVRHLVPAGTVAVDIGANFGIYTKVLSDLVGPRGRVIAAEPIDETFDLLQRNVRSFQFSNVSCVNAALSDSARVVTMQIPKYTSGGSNYYQARITEAPGEGRSVQVRTTTLDALVKGSTPISFVKLDVEGHEFECLAGANEVLTQEAPSWLIEISGDPDKRDSVARQTFDLFAGRGYSAWWLDGTRLIRRQSGDRSTNYFFLRDNHVAELDGRVFS